MRRHQVLESVYGADGNFGLEGGKRVHFCPEVDGVAEFTFRDQAKPLVFFTKHESASFFAHAFSIAFEQCVADVFAFEGKTSGLGGEMGADGRPNQIDGIGHGPGLIKVVDSPDQPALDVTPGTKILNVEIADSQNLRSFGEIRANFGPELRPTVKGRAEEREKLFLHAGVFEAKILLVQMCVLRQPGLELAGGLDHVHGGNDSGGANGKSNGRNPFTTETQRHREKSNERRPFRRFDKTLDEASRGLGSVSPLTQCLAL